MSPRHRHPVLNTAETHTLQCGLVRKALTRLTRNDSEFQDSTERLHGREDGGFFSHLFSWLCFFVFCSFPLLRKAHQRSLVDFGEEQPPASRKSDGAQFPDCAAADPGERPPRPEGHGPRSPMSPLLPPRPGRGGAGRLALGWVVVGFCFFVLFLLVPEKPRRATLLFQSGSAVPEQCSRSASTGPSEPGRGPRPPPPLTPTSSFLPHAPPPPCSLPSPSLPLHSPRLLPASACGPRTVSSSHPLLPSPPPPPLPSLVLPPPPTSSLPHPDLPFSNFLASSPPLLLSPPPSSFLHVLPPHLLSHPSSRISAPPAPQGCGRLPGVGRG
ncbi:vegetative cell wall protein gp1-like [Cervus elaphus]|uniref:vegetative cell wall protein gp1-like n=1 Tax=Cervus elaphus TaxID=9860 RepID=UPI001CC2EF3F|nr:vegetative cell wall protein gp1-like [Cervus elaphus]XP_043748157.1 vegetative cell wall protein gp1-like [Cervus elaphus]XP_043748158.1 vegetative cell wall protein gp1-like [Cervus elaphus]